MLEKMSNLLKVQNKRINERLLFYWEELKGERPFPSEGEIDPEAIEDIWDSCFLVRVEDIQATEAGYKYTYLGQDLVEAYGDDLQNKEICEKLIYPTNMSLVHKFEEILETKQPAIEEAGFTNTKNQEIRFRSCMLPLSKDSKSSEVAYIIGGMKWKAY